MVVERVSGGQRRRGVGSTRSQPGSEKKKRVPRSSESKQLAAGHPQFKQHLQATAALDHQ